MKKKNDVAKEEQRKAHSLPGTNQAGKEADSREPVISPGCGGEGSVIVRPVTRSARRQRINGSQTREGR